MMRRAAETMTSVGGVHRELRFVDDVAVELVAADLQEAALAPLLMAAADPGALGADPSDEEFFGRMEEKGQTIEDGDVFLEV